MSGRVESASEPAPGEVASNASGLTSLGLSLLEARLYLALLAGSKTAAEVADGVGESRARAASSLAHLVSEGLINRLPGRPNRFALTPPEWVLPALVKRREDEVERSRQLVRALAKRFREAAGEAANTEEYATVVVGTDAVLAQHAELLAGAREQVVTFVKGPIFDAPNPNAQSSLSRGVTIRAVWEQSVLEAPGMLDAARLWAERGEQIRVVTALPTKLVVVDRQVAVLHVSERSAAGRPLVAALLSRHPEVVDALGLLFEFLWDAGVCPFDLTVGTGGDDEQAAAERQKLLNCLAAGMKDRSIAHQLGVSERTVSRRIQYLINELGVDTRFQAGFILGKRARESAPASTGTAPLP